MGASICQKQQIISTNELKTSIKYKVNHPPHAFKPTPIIHILITDDQVEKEDSPLKQELSGYKQNLTQTRQNYNAQQSDEIENTSQKAWISKDFALGVKSNISKKECNNISSDMNQIQDIIPKTKVVSKNKFIDDISQKKSIGQGIQIKKSIKQNRTDQYM